METIFILVLSLFIVPAFNQTNAYLDPGSGSYILQVAIAFVLGAMVAIRISSNKIKIFFRNILNRITKKKSSN